MPFSYRLATRDDIPAISALMDRAIRELQRPYLSEDQIAASRQTMGLDTQLIDDGTYFAVFEGDAMVGCGGWSKRATLYGGNHSTDLRDERLLDPALEPARVRAMYTDPGHARRGIGRLILELCEAASRESGFTRLELMATLSGEPLYAAYGFTVIARVDRLGDAGTTVPGATMGKDLD